VTANSNPDDAIDLDASCPMCLLPLRDASGTWTPTHGWCHTHCVSVRTEDGVWLIPGDAAFNYYDRKSGVVGTPDVDGWFDFRQNDGTVAYLNSERICSESFARARGWLA
jgi:hypothetical protein